MISTIRQTELTTCTRFKLFFKGNGPVHALIEWDLFIVSLIARIGLKV